MSTQHTQHTQHTRLHLAHKENMTRDQKEGSLFCAGMLIVGVVLYIGTKLMYG